MFRSMLVLTAIAGCAPHHACLGEQPPTQRSTSATFDAYRVTASDGTCLQGYQWTPANQEVRGAVVVVHGLRDHARRYQPLVDGLNAYGLVVVGQDHRGHGASGGVRERFDSIAQLETDVQLAIDHARAAAPTAPLFLYGHSLGGLVTAQFAIDHPEGLAGIVLSGPGLMLPPSITGAQQSAAKLVGAVTPGFRVQKLDDTRFCREESARLDLAGDALVDHRNLPAASARAAVLAVQAMSGEMEQLTVPVLAMHGTLDEATNPKGSEELIRRAKSSDKTLKLWTGLYHDLLHEPEQAQVVETAVSWIDARLPAPTPPPVVAAP